MLENVRINSRVMKVTVKYAVYFLLLLLTGLSKINGIAPFGTGLFLALVYIGESCIIITPIYIIATLIINPTWHALIGCLTVGIVSIVATLISIKLKKKLTPFSMVGVSLLGQAGYLYIMILAKSAPLNIFLTVFFALVFMYVSIGIIKPIIVNKLKYKLLETEIACGGLFVVIISLGLSGVNILNVPLVAIVGAFTICCACYIGGVAGVVMGICIGVGNALYDYEITFIAGFALIALLSAIFVSAPRILSALAGVLAYIMFAFYFNVDYSHAVYWIIGLSIGGVLYSVVPRKILNQVKSYFFASHSRTAIRHMANRNKRDIGNNLYEASHIFGEMCKVIGNLPEINKAKIAESLGNKLKNSICAKCDKYSECRSSAEYNSAINSLMQVSINKGRVNVMDLPDMLTGACVNVAHLISVASELGEECIKLLEVKNNENLAKEIVSEQLSGVSKILLDMSDRAAVPICYDVDREKVIVEELTYRNIVCSEALVTGEKFPITVTLIIRTECLDKAVIEKTLSKVMRQSMKLSGIDDSVLAGWSIVYVESCPKFDVVFGAANCPKVAGGISGDTHSFIKINNYRFMMALCDGMGSGSEAERVSETAISLVENFYKAGFDNKLVLESVNKFLSLSADEAFSAIDICVVDLQSGDCDVIKIGTPETYIKDSETVEVISGGALPLGILDEMKPKVTTRKIKSGEMIVLTSDGVADSYSGDGLANAINNQRTINPQKLASSLLEETLKLNKDIAKDDMSVVAARVFPRV